MGNAFVKHTKNTVCVCLFYRDTPDDPHLSHQVHEGVLHSD